MKKNDCMRNEEYRQTVRDIEKRGLDFATPDYMPPAWKIARYAKENGLRSVDGNNEILMRKIDAMYSKR